MFVVTGTGIFKLRIQYRSNHSGFSNTQMAFVYWRKLPTWVFVHVRCFAVTLLLDARSARPGSVASHFNSLRHLKADMVCLTLVPALWSFWLLLMKGWPNSITRLINRRVHLWAASIIESVG